MIALLLLVAGEAPLESVDLPALTPVYVVSKGDATARRARIDGAELIVVDYDGDGAFDGWTVPGVRFLFPIEKRIVLGARVVALRVRRDSVEYDVSRTSPVLAECNRFRMAHGIAPLFLHEHRTNAKLRMRKVTPAAVARGVFRSFPNRIWLFHPALARIGIDETDDRIVLDIGAPLGRRNLVWPVLLPAPDSVDNPTKLYAGKPALFGAGLPITLQFPTAEVTNVTAELRRGKKALDVFVSWPAQPAHPSITNNAESICVVPKRELRPGTTYSVTVRYTYRGKAAERSWSFSTSGKAPVATTYKEQAPLRPWRLKRTPLFFFDFKAGPSPAARAAKIGRHTVVFLDLDGDGAFDAWMLKGERYAFPVEERIVLGDEDVELAVEKDVVRFTRATVPVRRAYRKALVTWNAMRRRNGLPPATLRLELCTHCENHAKYMDLNGMHAREDPKKKGYTPEGYEVGRRAAIVGLSDLNKALPFWERRFGGCHVFFSPHAWEAGIGNSGANAVLDPHARPRLRAWTWPVLVPAPESEGAPVASAATEPVLFPGQLRDAAAVGRAGAPIMLFFEKGKANFEKVEAEVREGGANGKPVEVLIGWPKHPAYEAVKSNYNAILVLPRKRLRKKTRYDVLVRAGGREHRWWFKTGRGK